MKQRWDNVISTWKQRWNNVVQRWFNVFSTSGTDVVSMLYNLENMTSDFVSFSTSDQRYFHVDSQRWSNVEMLAGYSFTKKGSHLRCFFVEFVKFYKISFSQKTVRQLLPISSNILDISLTLLAINQLSHSWLSV